MSIKTTNINNFIQDFTVKKEDKLFYGEIYSPFSLIKSMLSLFEPSIFSKPDAKWLDTGAGTGYFSMVLFDLLNKGLSTVIFSEEERKTHIIEKMLYLIELKSENVAILKERFGEKANIIQEDFLSYISESTIYFDYIIGNPPYNSHGMKKVPTNNKLQKKQDGLTIWGDFIKKSLSLLKPELGQLCYIVPSLWLKPDKAGLYNLLTQYKIEKLHCLTNTETNKIFKGEAQTPTCYFLLTNRITTTKAINNIKKTNHIQLYDKCRENYINYHYIVGNALPLFGQTIIQKVQPFILRAGGPIKALKTNMPSKKTKLSPTYDETHFPYPNISSCCLNGLKPELVINYSNVTQSYYNEIKLVLAHKMYGFPYLDSEGKYGISNRDNYVILANNNTTINNTINNNTINNTTINNNTINNTNLEYLKQLQAFLSTKFALYVYEATRYRMKYLEKYAFELLPNIANLSDFPKAEDINDKTVATYFGLDDEDEKNIQRLHKQYGGFPP